LSKVLGTDETIKTFDTVIKTTKQEGRKASLAQTHEHEQLKKSTTHKRY
jgi:hypothetical protein